MLFQRRQEPLGGAFKPTLIGEAGNDHIIGTENLDTIFGLDGNDTLEGRAAADTIDGEAGDDVLTGEGGADILTGGTGVDRFRDLAAGLNGDRITDFLPGDRISSPTMVQNATSALAARPLPSIAVRLPSIISDRDV